MKTQILYKKKCDLKDHEVNFMYKNKFIRYLFSLKLNFIKAFYK